MENLILILVMPEVEVVVMPEVMPELVDNNLLVLLPEHYFNASV